MNTFTRKALMLAALSALFIAGCTTNETRKAEADVQVAIGNARVAEANAAAEEAKAVQKLADKVDAGGASAYLIAKALKGIGAAQPVQVAQAPQSAWGAAWQAVLAVADVGLRVYGIKSVRDVGIAQSNNQRDVAISTNGAFLGMGQSIATAGTAGYPYVQAPAANVTTTLSGTGVLGSGTYTGPVTTTTNHNCPGGTSSPGGAGTAGAGTTPATPGGAGGAATGGTC